MDPVQIAIPVLRQIVKRPKLLELAGRFDRWGNLFAPERYSYPYPLFDAVRADGPISKRAAYGGWVVTGYEESRQILSSEHAAMGDTIDSLFKVKPYPQLAEQTRQLLRQILLFQDGDMHSRLRRLVSRTFTPRAVSQLEPRTAEIAHDMAAKLAAEGRHDAAHGFASPLPIGVISALIGVPDDRWEWARSQAEALVTVLDPINVFDPAVVDRAAAELISYFSALAEERKANRPTIS